VEETGEVIHARESLRVLLAEDLLCELQRLVVERLGRVVPALAVEETGEVVHARESLRVLLAEDLLSKLQRLAAKRLGRVVLAPKRINQACHCHTAHRITVLLTENPLSDFHCLNRHILCLHTFPYCPGVPCGLVEY